MHYVVKLTAVLENAVKWAAFLILLVMFLAILLQIFTRYILNDPLIWTEELANICFAWIVFLGAALGIRRDESVRMDLFMHRIPESAKHILILVQDLLLFLVAVLLMPPSLVLIRQVLPLELDALRASWAILYLPAPLFFVLVILFFPARIIQSILERRAHAMAREGQYPS